MEDEEHLKSAEEAKLLANEKMLASKAFIIVTMNDDNQLDYIWSTSQLNGCECIGFIEKIMYELEQMEQSFLDYNPEE